MEEITALQRGKGRLVVRSTSPKKSRTCHNAGGDYSDCRPLLAQPLARKWAMSNNVYQLLTLFNLKPKEQSAYRSGSSQPVCYGTFTGSRARLSIEFKPRHTHFQTIKNPVYVSFWMTFHICQISTF
jgi:hypothetical protein